MLDFAIDIACGAGEVLLKHYGKLKKEDIGYKGKSKRNLVTDVDKISERYLVGRIKDKFPKHRILTEESPALERESDYRWIVDPLDGTVNFCHSHPMFTVSIALEHKQKMILAVVYAPKMNELFYAEVAGGAFLNNKKIKVSTTTDLISSLLATGFAYDKEDDANNNIGNFKRLNFKVRGIRRGGSASLDLCYVACGRFDGFWELNLSPWDVAAGALLVLEAGGKVTDFKGGSNYIFGKNIIASNGNIHNLIRENLDEPHTFLKSVKSYSFL